ncbi:uncharacterized protein V6R79_002472 [Siganus canaliculatus]
MHHLTLDGVGAADGRPQTQPCVAFMAACGRRAGGVRAGTGTTVDWDHRGPSSARHEEISIGVLQISFPDQSTLEIGIIMSWLCISWTRGCTARSRQAFSSLCIIRGHFLISGGSAVAVEHGATRGHTGPQRGPVQSQKRLRAAAEGSFYWKRVKVETAAF